jgi:hypothetical protein
VADAVGDDTDRIPSRFARAEPRRRVLACLRGLLGAVTRRTAGRARQGGNPDGMQWLMSTAGWDPNQSLTTCVPMWWSTGGPGPGAGGGRDRVPQEGPPGWVCSASIRQGWRSTTASWRCSWPLPGNGAGVHRSGAVPAPLDQRPARCRAAGCLRRSGSDQAAAGPGDAEARLGRAGAGRLGDRR